MMLELPLECGLQLLLFLLFFAKLRNSLLQNMMLFRLWHCDVWGRQSIQCFTRLQQVVGLILLLICLFPQRQQLSPTKCTISNSPKNERRRGKNNYSGSSFPQICESRYSGRIPERCNIFSFLPNGTFLHVEALPKVELLEVRFAGNHSLASDYGVSYEPYGMYMESGEPYSEPLLLDVAASGYMHLVYHHCPYTDAKLQGWKFHGNLFVTERADEGVMSLQRRKKMCVARRVEIRSDGEQEGSELTLTAGDRQEPRFFGYRLDDNGYIAYFIAFTRMLPSACIYLDCCRTNSSLPCEIVFYDVKNPEHESKFRPIVGTTSVNLSRECPLCRHYGRQDGVPIEYFTSIEEDQLTQECPNLQPFTYGDSFVFLGPGYNDSRVHKNYAIGSLGNTLQIREFKKMTQVSVQYPNNLWLSRAGAYHESFNPPEAERSYYIIRGAEYITADSSRQELQEVLFFYDSLANAQENKGTEFISGLKQRAEANTKTSDAIFAEHPIANDMSYFYSNPVDKDVRFVAGGGFKLPAAKFVDPAAIKGFCVAPLFYDQWAVFLALEEVAVSTSRQQQQPLRPRQPSTWEDTPLPWWSDDPISGYSSARRGQLLYMQIPISGTRSYNEVTLQVFNASSYRSFHCSAAGSASVLLLHHDVVNHILHMEERLRDGSLVEDSQVEIRRVLHGSLLPSRTVMSLEKGPDSVLWVNMLTTKRFSVDESFYYVPADLPGRLASIQRATGFYKDGDCVGEWVPSLSSATCSHFCVSLHLYQVKIASSGGSACTFERGTELSRHCLESPCSRGEIQTIELNPPVKRDAATRQTAADAMNGGQTRLRGPGLPRSVTFGTKGEIIEGGIRRSVDSTVPPELETWLDNMLDTSAQVPLGTDGVALATIELKSAIDMWHLRIVFASVAGQTNSTTARVASFDFSLSVLDDADELIHTWQTRVPPSPAAQSVWEAMDLRLYRAKSIRLEAAQPFRVAELQVFGMPLPKCPIGGFLGPAGCSVPTVQRLRQHNSLDCQGAWSEWTACQADCRRKRFMNVYQTEKEGGVPCQYFEHEPCQDGLCSAIYGVSLLKSEDCYPSPSRWSECIGCRQMRAWHILRAASAAGTACPSSIFETRTCRTSEGCDVSTVVFPAPPDQPAAEDNSAKETELMRPIGGYFLAAAVALVFLILAGLEIWRRWGTSISAQREVLNIQRQRDLIAAREQIRQYRQMIQDYKEQLENEEQSEDTQNVQLDSFLMQHAVVADVTEKLSDAAKSSATPESSPDAVSSEARDNEIQDEKEPHEDKKKNEMKDEEG